MIMKHTLAIVLMVIGLVGCSNLEEKLNVICESDFHDNSLTFDFKNNVISVRKTLNEHGYEQKKMIKEKIANLKKSTGKDLTGQGELDILGVFDEEEITKHIRSVDEGFIVFGLTKEFNEFIDTEWTLNRATLKMKVVFRMKESVITKAGIEPIKVSYEECKQPVI